MTGRGQSISSKAVGEYYLPNRGGGFTIILNQDGSYIQSMQDCTWAFKTKGKWTTKNDTLYLNADKIYNQHGKKMKFDTISTNFNSYNNMRKFLLKSDTLFILMHNTAKYPMVKQRLILDHADIEKIKIKKEKSDPEPEINCPFVFSVDSTILNKMIKPSNVFFSGRGYTKDTQKKFDEIKPFMKDKKYLISYESVQYELKEFCTLETIKILKVEIRSVGDSLFTITATFGSK